ncbi:DUF362 domain-containing protein [Candidatus Borrarchaeum sp.]|uniref:DUF362 domain-containing protein n=1 Tax=Candidatus Borrarchaeum sp. TaxID=2846742 RepID=UPI00257CCB8D|nr:DUF362 domain-containing protein [Candidatus Borrarchaeum sp.]
MTKRDLVSLVEIKNDNLRDALNQALGLIDIKINKANKIVIKPNLCYYWHSSTGETTDPQIVSTLIDFIRDNIGHDSDISIVESDATAMRTKYSFKFLGYEDLAREKDVKLVNLSQDEYKIKKIDGYHLQEVKIPETLLNADYFISVPKLKLQDPSLTPLTCALKNQFGCIPIQKKSQYHPVLSEVISDVNSVISPNLCVVDGRVVKYNSKIIPLNLIIAGTNSLATDIIAAKVLRLNPKKIKCIHLYSKLAGNTQVEPIGTPITYFSNKIPKNQSGRISRKLKKFAYRIYRSINY